VEALILAAGAGTRLRPLTRHKPKPLFPVLNRPLLALSLEYLRRQGVRRFILNTHHLGDQVRAFVRAYAGRVPDLILETRPETEILGTGGGIKNTVDFWRGDTFLVLNGDIVTDIDLGPALAFHRDRGGPVTLILQDHSRHNNIVVGPGDSILKFRDQAGTRAFTGIHILDRRILDFFPPVAFYDIIPVYQGLIDRGIPVRGYLAGNHYWRDMGSPESYRDLHREILSGLFDPGMNFSCSASGTESKWCLDPRSEIAPGVRLEGWGTVGAGSRLSPGCRIRNSILWEGVGVGEGVVITDSIVGDLIDIDTNLTNKIIC
jgi:NDP-sugar pyrophosphorylase family protein